MRLLLLMMTCISGSLLMVMSAHQYRLRQAPSSAAMLAFVDDQRTGSQLFSLDPSSTLPQLLDTGRSLYDIDYAPDGEWLVAVDTTADNDALVRYDLESGVLTTLSSGPGDESGPVISPDGTQIAFASTVDNGIHLFLMDSDGANLRQLTADGLRNYQPTWTPDGRALVFSRSTGNNQQLYRYELDNGTLLAITSNSALLHGEAAVSTDGRWITYTAFQPPNRERYLYVLSLETATSTQLTANGDVAFFPTWSVDGAWIYFSRPSLGDANDIYRIRRDGSRTVAVTQTATINEERVTVGPPIDAGGSLTMLGVMGALLSLSSAALWGSVGGWGWVIGVLQAATAIRFTPTSTDRISIV